MAKNVLTVELQQQDDNGAVLARTKFDITETDPDSGEWRSGFLLTTAETTISFAGVSAQARQILLRNTHATAKITVKWTPYGGAEATIGVIGPGGFMGWWDDTAAAASIGISGMKLTSDTASTTFLLFLGG